MSAGRNRTALVSALAYGIVAGVATAAAAAVSPLLPDGGRWWGAAAFTVASLWLGFSYGPRYVTSHPGAARTPLWLALYAGIFTALVWGYGYAWFYDPSVTRFSILAPFVGLIRGVHFALLLTLSASPLLMPGWWGVNQLLQRLAERIYVSTL